MIVKGLILHQMTCWSLSDWEYSSPLVILQSTEFRSLSGSTMHCTNVPGYYHNRSKEQK